MSTYGQSPGLFPHIWRPYLPQSLPHPVLENSPRLGTLIHDGKLELSIADAIALTLENNLDIVVQRYVIPFSQTDILRTKSGQAARGFTGALLPGELNSGAIGAGVTSTGSTGGTGNAGGITGGGGAVSIGAAGAFDPSVNFGLSWDRVTSPLNSVVVSGIPTTTSYATSYSGSYAQLFTNGSSYSVSFSALRQSTTQQNTLFNPDVDLAPLHRIQPAAARRLRPPAQRALHVGGPHQPAHRPGSLPPAGHRQRGATGKRLLGSLRVAAERGAWRGNR